ncbi:hypothetical protein AB6A40_006168 [Gnathostoma spinigerum]|uniref:PDEase domain-containing protein n=1 Tax=Gnathostoma spinigerum TaxID=75299 RepID=A0ABD6EQ82_9BILA
MEAILMTGCDLIAAAKPWEVQQETVKVIVEEFYEQGDDEKRCGREPLAMMDRNKANELPKMQVDFMEGICLPCYKLLASIVPCTKQLEEQCSYNAKKWAELMEESCNGAKEDEQSTSCGHTP